MTAESPRALPFTCRAPLLQVEHLGVRYGSQWALRGVDLDIWHGDLLAFIGPNGAGKSTLLKALLRQAILAAVIGLLLITQMRRYTLSTLSPELAHVQRVPAAWLNYAFALLIAATVVVSLKMLGALLLSALLVIPAAAAKLVSGSFRSLLLVSLAGGLAAPLFGVLASARLNIPTRPCIVLTNVLFLILCYGWKLFRARIPAA